jgi:DNA polymerase III subunit gamma/tau
MAETLAYRVLARKYRPKAFADLIGQEALVRTLTNAFATGRIAQAYMLTGVRGIGKTTTARLIARALNYPPGAAIDMPEMTPTCEAILESRHMDVIEMDAASNTGVDNMREIIESVRYAPVEARIKVYIIDEVHMLSKSAFNALLKTLEEPPPHVKFVFATTEIRKVPVTILSRCQRFDLKRLDAGLLTEHFQRICGLENVEVEEEALRLIARAAEGSVRDGLSLLDQAIAYGENAVKTQDVLSMLGIVDRTRVVTLFEALMSGDVTAALNEMALQYQSGGDPHTILADLAEFTHYVTRFKIVPEVSERDQSRTTAERAKGKELASKLSVPHLSRAWQMLLKGLQETAQAARPDLAAEMVLIRLAHASDLPTGDELVRLVKAPPASAPLQNEASRAPSAPQALGGNGGGPVAQRKPLEKETVASSQPPTVILKDFAAIVALAADKRDIKLKTELERFVRPIAVQGNKVEIALEKDAPSGLPGELGRKLEMWTGRRYMVSVAREGGTETLHRQKKSAEAIALAEVKARPDVQAFLKAFPGAEILKVREPETFVATEIVTEETDEESR